MLWGGERVNTIRKNWPERPQHILNYSQIDRHASWAFLPKNSPSLGEVTIYFFGVQLDPPFYPMFSISIPPPPWCGQKKWLCQKKMSVDRKNECVMCESQWVWVWVWTVDCGLWTVDYDSAVSGEPPEKKAEQWTGSPPGMKFSSATCLLSWDVAKLETGFTSANNISQREGSMWMVVTILRRDALARHVSYYLSSSPLPASLTQLGSFPKVSRAQGQVTLSCEFPASSHVTFRELPL